VRYAQDHACHDGKRLVDPSVFESVTATGLVNSACAGDSYKRVEEALSKYRFPAGSVIAIALPNSLGLLNLFVAVLNLGLVPALLAPGTPTKRLGRTLDSFRARALVKGKISRAQQEKIGITNREDFLSWSIADFGDRDTVSISGEVIITTSGTSSDFSSGCVHNFGSLLRNARRHAESIGQRSVDTVLINLPIYYSTALVAQFLAACSTGSKIVISGAPFNVRQYLDDIEHYEVTISSLTPVLLRLLNSCSSSRICQSLKKMTVGGDFLPNDDVRQFLEAYPDKELYLTYGITEAGPRVSTCAAHLVTEERWTSVGVPIDGTDTKIMSVGDDPTVGELLVSSDTLLKRKIGASVSDPTSKNDGKRWLSTGDIFRKDKDGYLFFLNRKTDFIVVGGEKVNLAAIRGFILEMPEVVNCSTRVLHDNGSVRGYALNLLCDSELVDEDSKGNIVNRVENSLRMVERPININLELVNKNSINVHK
jgi:acyl-CoA synthetase (AMP-forming)/AMP-acid ligase II